MFFTYFIHFFYTLLRFFIHFRSDADTIGILRGKVKDIFLIDEIISYQTVYHNIFISLYTVNILIIQSNTLSTSWKIYSTLLLWTYFIIARKYHKNNTQNNNIIYFHL